MVNRVLLDSVRRSIDRIDALGLDQNEQVEIDPTAIIDALREVRDHLEEALALPSSFAARDPDWMEHDRRQCGKVAHLI